VERLPGLGCRAERQLREVGLIGRNRVVVPAAAAFNATLVFTE